MYLNSNLNISCILTITQGVLSIAIFNIYKNERGVTNLMNVFELRLKIYLLQDIGQPDTYQVFAHFLDSYLAKNNTFLEFHQKNCYKMYCFDQPYPVEKDSVYKKEHIYTVRIRTVNTELADYLSNGLSNHFNNQIKGLTIDIKMIPKKFISEIYSITPTVIKCTGGTDTKGGYWKHSISFEEYENRIKSNLIKKMNTITGSKIQEDFELYRQIELVNRKPIAVPYKGIKLLGDKLRIQAAENEQAQELMYLAVGTGLGEFNARGGGFVNFRYL